jgi:hypothetical protein
MGQTIHFEEDLYFLNELLNTLESGIALNLDRLFFFDKIIEDIFFIDTTIGRLYSALGESYRIVQVENLSQGIITLKQRFTDFLSRIISSSTGMGEAFSPFVEKFSDMHDSHRRDVEELQQSLLSSDTQSTPREVISQEEYQFLFPSDDEKE